MYQEEVGFLNSTSILSSAQLKNEWERYLYWAKKFACCKLGSIYLRDHKGYGIKPSIVNVVSLLSFYHLINPNELEYFPFGLNYDFISKTRRQRSESEEQSRV